MPVMGVGVYRIDPGMSTEDAVKEALSVGYRMIDTAAFYKNERSVGEAIRYSGIPRSEIFLATKLWDEQHGYEAAQGAVRESLQNLGVDYVDLYLIHSPHKGKLLETWDSLLVMKASGLARNVGVSNFGIPHLKAIKDHGRELPAVNQIELHPLNWKERQPLLEFCKENGILVQAYGSLMSGKAEFMSDEILTNLAEETGKTPAQLLLRWGHQMGLQLIPKSSHHDRLVENSNIFDFSLSEDAMYNISSMEGQLEEYWNPLEEPVNLGDVERFTSIMADTKFKHERRDRRLKGEEL
eukprot:TRINITY_DN31403_c0_g1_i1.p1 TRINITY_DN31403_c0_g1~~TRINITY_DN31403_c0_g1_i1.p1  ORF type:complete len:296 (+),score=46.14 TRINITY_DN31403_c0_g1_i1:228-1115(+)